jgi:hypothetical protein
VTYPAAIAAPTFLVIIAAGKFHGVIAPTTPTGCLKVRILQQQQEEQKEEKRVNE